MSVRKVKNKWMIDVVFTHSDGREQRVRKVAPVQTRRNAEQYEREVRFKLSDGTYGRKEVAVPRMSEFAKEFRDTYAATHNKKSEQVAKERMLRVHLEPFFGSMRLDKIDRLTIDRFIAQKLEEKLSPKTIKNNLAVLGRMLTVAKEYGVLTVVPAMPKQRFPKARTDFLTFEEADRLLKATEREWFAMVQTALGTGLRLGELLALQWEDVDLHARRITVRRNLSAGLVTTPKSHKERMVDLNEAVYSALKSHRHLRGSWVFCSESGTRLTHDIAKTPLRRACRRAGLRRIGWHALRHTFASHLVMRGAPLNAVQEFMGHSTVQMTMRYSHLCPETKRSVIRLLDEPSPVRAPDGSMAAPQERDTAM